MKYIKEWKKYKINEEYVENILISSKDVLVDGQLDWDGEDYIYIPNDPQLPTVTSKTGEEIYDAGYLEKGALDNISLKESLSVGTKVKTSMGLPAKGKVIPRFNWKESTDGTYNQPSKDDIPILWDNGDKGYYPEAYLTVINPDGSEEPQGRLISDEEYDTTGDIENIEFKDEEQESGYVTFEDGTVDSFIIYDDGRIAFDKWYPDNKYNLLVKSIRKQRKTIFRK
jgi:hypothetical protein